ncbi:carbohydrate ABC transporter permease [Amycolatopsis regifaucium]|uniref:ABC transporter permease n=1 Tax=Amycolatopsis regifaucium TaxID=546365 RepID=A0A154MPS9_9PSEU|nr:sugar ABC transporter permease [Amycolatopsis regifaucium]KZB86100.1 ABC transporter permease [Amycolatopsis regifaucium]OKA04993.1 ABC transporter permease [Amycolatopsis regifaucium]SFH77878.1 carbohydrate ABC transporter membrane protein 1, CUT1 family [Amycolatopsis regifaucium]
MPTTLDDAPAVKAAGVPKPQRVRRGRRRVALPYLLLLPAILLELLVHLIPMVAGLVMSFFKLTQFSIRDFSSAPAAGLDNYKFVLDFNSAAGKALLGSFWISVVYTVLSVGFCWLFGTSAAVLMQKNFRGRGVLRTLFLMPYALPMYAAVITWSFMFQRDTGLVNSLLGTDSFWLIGDNSFWSLVVVSVWRNWPFAFLIVMAGLQNIPGELYEAAAIDGAGWWRQFQAITQPMLRPVNQVLLLVLFLWTFNDFNTPYVLFGASAPKEASLISIHIYQSSFVTWNFGLGSAMSVLLLLFLLIVSTVCLGLTSRRRKAVV